MIALQSGAPFFAPAQLQGVCDQLSSSFKAVRPFLAPVPTYAGGMLALIVAGPTITALAPSMKVLRQRFRDLHLDTRYYNPDIHRAAFVLPPMFADIAVDERDGAQITGRTRPAGRGELKEDRDLNEQIRFQ